MTGECVLHNQQTTLVIAPPASNSSLDADNPGQRPMWQQDVDDSTMRDLRCTECEQTRSSFTSAQAQADPPQREHNENEARYQRELGLLRAVLQECEDDRDATLQQNAIQLEIIKREHTEERQTIEAASKKCQAEWKEQLEEAQKALQAGLRQDLARIQEKHAKEMKTLEEHHQENMTRMMAQVDLLDHQRRKWLSQVQVLRGGFRVVCRMQPFLPGEEKEFSSEGAGDDRGDGNGWLRCSPAPPNSNATVLLHIEEMNKAYPMDEFLGPSKTTSQVADEIEPLVYSLVWADGAARIERGVVLACGQTASGKTTCIRAFLKRVAASVYGDGDGDGDDGGSSTRPTIACSFVQVYGDEYDDLFADIKKDKQTTPPLRIYPRGADGFVVGAQVRTAASKNELMALFKEGSAQRRTRDTEMNTASSRSHGFFTMVFHTNNTNDKKPGMLTLVDLAGTEKPSTADKESSKEGIEINKSLVALRSGMARLKQANISNPNSMQSFFRGNKMTELLGYMLGEDATMVRILVLLTVNPGVAHRHQSLSTLEFGVLVSSRTVVVKRSGGTRAVPKPKTS